MALLINKTGLKKADGTEITTQPIVRFFDQGSLKGFNRKFFMEYWVSLELEQQNFGSINIIYDEDKNILPNSFVKELTIEDLAFWEQIAEQNLPGQPAAVKVPFVYHLWVKEVLETYLGENSVTIRLDLM